MGAEHPPFVALFEPVGAVPASSAVAAETDAHHADHHRSQTVETAWLASDQTAGADQTDSSVAVAAAVLPLAAAAAVVVIVAASFAASFGSATVAAVDATDQLVVKACLAC